MAVAACTKLPGQLIILDPVEIGVFTGEILFRSTLFSIINIYSGATSTCFMNVVLKAMKNVSGLASLARGNVQQVSQN